MRQRPGTGGSVQHSPLADPPLPLEIAVGHFPPSTLENSGEQVSGPPGHQWLPEAARSQEAQERPLATLMSSGRAGVGLRPRLPRNSRACPHQHFLCTCAVWPCPMLSDKPQAAVALRPRPLAAVPSSADLLGTQGAPRPAQHSSRHSQSPSPPRSSQAGPRVHWRRRRRE